jgi:SNF2 family DNA or RNA helicase
VLPALALLLAVGAGVLKYLDTSSEQPILPAPAQPTDEIAAKPESDPKEDKVLTNIAATAQSLQPTGYTLETTTVKTQVPVLLLKHTLREYQHVGLDWLVTMNENKLNGILADEMGLGKTIQSLTFCKEMSIYGVNGPFLILVPLSTIGNWIREFETWTDFNCIVYHGSSASRQMLQDYEFYFVDGGNTPNKSNSIANSESFDLKKGRIC